MPSAGASALSAIAEPLQAATGGGASVFFPALHCLEHILIDSAGRQHVVLRASGMALQLTIKGADIVNAAVNLTFLVRGFSAIRAATSHLSTLRRILSPISQQPSSPAWTPTTRKLRDAILTLDGRTAGASYQEIALILHGPKIVELNWRTGLKERMRRHFGRGIALSTGGYRKLLDQV
jgi:hypothetical protein